MNIPPITYQGQAFIYKEGDPNPIDPLYYVDQFDGVWRPEPMTTYSEVVSYRENFRNDIFASRDEALRAIRSTLEAKLAAAKESIPKLEKQLKELEEAPQGPLDTSEASRLLDVPNIS